MISLFLDPFCSNLVHRSSNEAVKLERANVWYGTPTMYVDMLAHPKRNEIDFEELRSALG